MYKKMRLGVDIIDSFFPGAGGNMVVASKKPCVCGVPTTPVGGDYL